MGSFGEDGGGIDGSGMGAYVVVVVVVVTTLRIRVSASQTRKRLEHTHVVVLTDGARKRDGRGWVFIVYEDEDVVPRCSKLWRWT